MGNLSEGRRTTKGNLGNSMKTPKLEPRNGYPTLALRLRAFALCHEIAPQESSQQPLRCFERNRLLSTVVALTPLATAYEGSHLRCNAGKGGKTNMLYNGEVPGGTCRRLLTRFSRNTLRDPTDFSSRVLRGLSFRCQRCSSAGWFGHTGVF